MELSERETIICINRAELAEGYFTASTSEAMVAKRLELRAKRAKALVKVHVERDAETKEPVYWVLYLKSSALSSNWLPVKSTRSGNAEALQKAREAKALA